MIIRATGSEHILAAAQRCHGGNIVTRVAAGNHLHSDTATLAKLAEEAAQLAGRLPRDRRGDSTEFVSLTAAALLAGPDDTEHPDAQDGLQSRLAELAAAPRLAHLRAALRQSGDWEGIRLLEDLNDCNTDHRWLWVLSASDNSI